jgi:Bacterial regulatory proteins, gntR family
MAVGRWRHDLVLSGRVCAGASGDRPSRASWFPEQTTALETATASELAINNKPSDDINGLTPVERLARAFRGQPSVSEGLRRQAVDLLTQTEHRFRNFLDQGAFTAFYFGGLFDEGRHAVAREFWATTEADGVLMSGSYWPFGKPRAWHEQRPSYPLFFLESQLAALLSEDPKPPPHLRQAGNRRGRKPIKLEQVKEAMRRDLSQGSELQNMREKELAAKYGVSRDTARKARDAVVPKIVDN